MEEPLQRLQIAIEVIVTEMNCNSKRNFLCLFSEQTLAGNLLGQERQLVGKI